MAKLTNEQIEQIQEESQARWNRLVEREVWYGFRNGRHVATYPSRLHADGAIERREIDSASPATMIEANRRRNLGDAYTPSVPRPSKG